MALFYKMGIGILLDNNHLVLVSITKIIFFLFLTSALLWIQATATNRYSHHLAKGTMLFGLSHLLFIPFYIIMSYSWGASAREYFNIIAVSLPKVVVHLIFQLLTIIPMVLMAALVCYLMLRRNSNKSKIEASEHLIEY